MKPLGRYIIHIVCNNLVVKTETKYNVKGAKKERLEYFAEAII